MSGHEDGPWSWEKFPDPEGDGATWVLKDAAGDSLFEMSDDTSTISGTGMAKIAAAPVMYELIRDALDGDDFRERAAALLARIDGKAEVGAVTAPLTYAVELEEWELGFLYASMASMRAGWPADSEQWRLVDQLTEKLRAAGQAVLDRRFQRSEPR